MSPVSIIAQLSTLGLFSEAVVMSTIVGFGVATESAWIRALVNIIGVGIIVVPILCFWMYRNFPGVSPHLKDVAFQSATVIFSTEGGMMLALEVLPFAFNAWQGILFKAIGFSCISTIAIYFWVLKPICEEQDERSMSLLTGTILAGLVAFSVLILDLSLPLGVAGGVPYVALILVGLWFPHRNAAIVLAIAGTLLIFVGYFLSPPGGVFWIVLTNRALAIFALWVTALLITKFKGYYGDLEKSEANLANAQRIAHLGNWEWNMTNGSLWWSGETYRLFGRKPATYEVSYDNYLKAVHPADREKIERAVSEALQGGEYAVEHAIVLPDNRIRYVAEQGEVVFDRAGNPSHLFGTVRDITERKETEFKLMHLANHDTLTGLPTRNLGIDHLSTAMANARRHKSKAAVLFIDLDGFKKINDTLGHGAGDHVLKETAVRLCSCVREVDTVARIGGDEFIIVLTDIEDKAGVSKVAKKVIQTVAAAYKLGTAEAHISASVGIALYPGHGKNPEQLLKRADQAMYQIKHKGKNNFAFAVFLDAQD